MREYVVRGKDELSIGPIGTTVAFKLISSAAHHFDHMHGEFWRLPKIQPYLEADDQTDEGLLGLLAVFGIVEKFLVMIVSTTRQFVYMPSTFT